MAAKEPIRVLLTGAAGQIGYAVLPLIAKGHMFGADQPVIIHLLDVPFCEKALGGVVLELEDCSYPLVAGIVATTTSLEEAFSNIDYAILVGAFPRKDGMERKDLLAKNCTIFKDQGEALDKFAKKTVKVLVVGNPANTNAAIAKANAPSIPAQNFTALTRLDHNRAKAQLAKRFSVSPKNVHNVAIWGNHSSTQYPNPNHGYYIDADGQKKEFSTLADQVEYFHGDFMTTVQKRGAAIIAARKLSSALSAANAIADHINDWHFGTKDGEFVSMAVSATGKHYGIREGVIYSFPVTISNGEWTIVDNLSIDEFSRAAMDKTANELYEEFDMATEILKSS